MAGRPDSRVNRAWDKGIGYLVLAREDPQGAILFASFLVHVLRLEVKDAFWKATSRS